MVTWRDEAGNLGFVGPKADGQTCQEGRAER